jgi:Prp8 binding protein
MVLKGHSNAILDVKWSSDNECLLSASADKTIALWDAQTGERLKKFVGHLAVVNSCALTNRGIRLLASGSDDSSIKLWDARVKRCSHTIPSNFPVTSVCFSLDNMRLFSAGIDNDIKVWDLRKNEIILRLEGHDDTVTGIQLSHDGSYLLSNSMDNTVRIWDVKPFVQQANRNIKQFNGVQHNFEKTLLRCAWSPDGSKISAGSADRFVYIWDTETRKILYKLPGHRGSVNDVDFHPTEPIIGSASSDRTIYLGEIKS